MDKSSTGNIPGPVGISSRSQAENSKTVENSTDSARTILKRKNEGNGSLGGEQKEAPRIKWDEENLALMESQKDSTMLST